MEWIRLQANITESADTLRVADALRPIFPDAAEEAALAGVIRMLTWTARNYDEGTIPTSALRSLARALHPDHRKGQAILDALLTPADAATGQPGFLEKDNEGTIIVHSWKRYQRYLLDERQRKANANAIRKEATSAEEPRNTRNPSPEPLRSIRTDVPTDRQGGREVRRNVPVTPPTAPPLPPGAARPATGSLSDNGKTAPPTTPAPATPTPPREPNPDPAHPDQHGILPPSAIGPSVRSALAAAAAAGNTIAAAALARAQELDATPDDPLPPINGSTPIPTTDPDAVRRALAAGLDPEAADAAAIAGRTAAAKVPMP